MSEIIQSYTGTLDNLNMSGIVFSLNMSGAQSTLADNKFALKSITFAKPSSAGYQDPVYLNLWEMKEGESTYTYITSSTNASNTTTSSDGVWNFTGVELDIDSKYYLTVTASQSSVMSDLILVRSRVYSVPSGSGVGSHNYINNYNPPSLQFNWMPVMSLTLDETIEGSINISKGYYDSGSAKIIMPASTVSLTDLKSGETVGCKNKLFVYSKNNVAGVKITGDRLADISTAHDVSVDLNQPIYLDHTKEYIAGGAEIAPEWSFSNGGSTPNFVATGSLTFGADGEVSGFSSSNTLKLDRIFTATSTQSFEISFKVKTGSSIGDIQEIFAMSPPLLLRTSSGCWNLPYNTGSWNDSNKDSVSASTVYFVKILYYPTTTTVGGVTYTAKYLYFEVYDSSKTLLHRYNYSLTGNFLNFQNAEAYIGSQGGSGEHWGGSIFLDENAYIKLDGELFWEPYTTIAPGITTQKALVYDNVNDKTFWYPSVTSLALSNFTTPADRSNLYYLNLFNVAAQLHAGESAPGSGDYMQSSDYVYLNHAHDKILGVQEEPDEIVLEAIGTKTENYTVTGSPSITDDYIATFSSGSLINPTPQWTYSGSPWAIELKFTTPTSYVGGNGVCLFRWGSNDCMIFLNSGGYIVGCGWSSYPRVAVSLNTTYWLKVEYDGTNLNMYLSTTGEYPTTPTDSSSSPAYWPSNNVSTVLGAKSAGSETFNGSIDLKEVRWYSNGTKVWEAVSTASPNTVEVSQDNYWTYLQGDSYDAQGATLAVSGMSPSALTGHILVDTSGTLSYSEDTDISQSALLPTKAYTGYDVTFTDNTYTSIQSTDKVGTKCRIYSSNVDAETGSQLFVVLPVTEYEEGFEGGSLPYKSVVQSLLGLKTPLEYTTTKSFVVTTTPGVLDYYDPTEDKFYIYSSGVWTGFKELSYSGDAYILDSTGA